MKGEKYIAGRVDAMVKSNSPILSSMLLRVGLVLAVLFCGYVSCEQGLKFVDQHPELDCTRNF